MRYSDASSLGVLVVLLLISFGFSYLVLDIGLETIEMITEKFEMISKLS